MSNGGAEESGDVIVTYLVPEAPQDRTIGEGGGCACRMGMRQWRRRIQAATTAVRMCVSWGLVVRVGTVDNGCGGGGSN
eukprot:1821986-Prymnesium_polylepis.1